MSENITRGLTPASLSANLDEPDPAVQGALLAAIVHSSDDAIISKTLEGRILSWNPGATRLFGYAAAEAIGKPITLIVPPELHEEEQRILARLRRGERIDHYDTARIARDGRRLHVSLTVSPVRNSRGVIVAASSVARDVTGRVRAEQTLRHSERRLASEVQALARLSELSTRLWRAHTLEEGLGEMLEAVIELMGADKGNIQLLNDDGRALSIVTQRGFEPHFLEFFREVSAEDESACGRALRSRGPVIIEDIETDAAFEPMREVARAAGYRAVVSAPLIGTDGAPLGMVSTHFRAAHRPSGTELSRLGLYLRQASDFIQRCKLDQALRDNEEVLREADRRKDEFLALLAHELRNPLAPIRYALAAAKKPDRTAAEQRHAEEVIERQVAHMSRLLDDLLDISRITHGTLELQKGPTELTSVVEAAIETARPFIDSKHHRLALELPGHARRFEGDAVRLAQIFANLLINAAKYTDPGGCIGLQATQEENELVVTVRDNGIGIPPEMMPRLFTLFAQAGTPGRTHEGLGVGLSLVRGLVTLHGGTVEARSEGAGRGSEFIVRLPVRSPRAREYADGEAAPAGAAGAALKILVVDDNRDTADSCAALLELSGHRVQRAYSGYQALELAGTLRPDVVLLDIGLPDIDGYELARRMRSAPWGHTASLVAVTGWGQDEDRRRAAEVGFDHHLTKPAAAESLNALLRSLSAARSEKAQ